MLQSLDSIGIPGLRHGIFRVNLGVCRRICGGTKFLFYLGKFLLRPLQLLICDPLFAAGVPLSLGCPQIMPRQNLRGLNRFAVFFGSGFNFLAVGTFQPPGACFQLRPFLWVIRQMIFNGLTYNL